MTQKQQDAIIVAIMFISGIITIPGGWWIITTACYQEEVSDVVIKLQCIPGFTLMFLGAAAIFLGLSIIYKLLTGKKPWWLG